MSRAAEHTGLGPFSPYNSCLTSRLNAKVLSVVEVRQMRQYKKEGFVRHTNDGFNSRKKSGLKGKKQKIQHPDLG